ncbi:MAG: hypothetical protein SFW66_00315, partial [Gammaproteobacteria bacterium]|nr:hypothetical protein [Gammaproteobacteria bacterium]
MAEVARKKDMKQSRELEFHHEQGYLLAKMEEIHADVRELKDDLGDVKKRLNSTEDRVEFYHYVYKTAVLLGSGLIAAGA